MSPVGEGSPLPQISDFYDRTGGETPPLQIHEQILAGRLFSLPICVIMDLTKSFPPRGMWHGVVVTENIILLNGGDI